MVRGLPQKFSTSLPLSVSAGSGCKTTASRRFLSSEMESDVPQENVNVEPFISSLHVLLAGRGDDVGMHPGEVLIRIQLRDELASRREEHNFDGVLPLSRQVFRQLIAAFGPFLDVVNNGGSEHESSV